MAEVTHEQAWRILQDRTRDDFKIFLRRAFGVVSPGVDLEWDWYLDAICEHLEALEKGIITKLIINQPPRTLKSITAGVAFSAWLLGKNPSTQIIGASYNSDLAEKMNMDTRQVINTDWYQEIFPGTKIAADQNQKWRFLTTKQGHRTAVSVGGKVTGFGADCFVAGTRVRTPRGTTPIKRLVEGNIVLTHNHTTGNLEPKPVRATNVRESENIVRVRFSNGREFRCTADHRVYSRQRGYTAAGDLHAGEAVIVYDKNSVHSLQHKSCPAIMRYTKSSEKRLQRFLLQQEMFVPSPFVQEFQKMQDVREFSEAEKLFLLGSVQTKIKNPKNYGAPYTESEDMRGVRKRFLASLKQNKNVFDALLEQAAFASYVVTEEPELPGWSRIQCSFQEDPKTDTGARRAEVPRLQKDDADNGRAPHRRKYSQQFARKFADIMQFLSSKAPQKRHTVVESVTKDSAGAYKVYDIQVEGNHNFFAEGILVHNCIMIDDPESPNEAMSDATRKSTNLWIRQNLMTRFNDRRKERVVIVQQRVHEDDTTGNLMEDGGWTLLKLPAEFPKKTFIQSPLGGPGWTKEEGDLLAPKILPITVLDQERVKLGIYGYASQYDQEPAPLEGGLIKLAWFKHYKERPLQYDYVFHSWDTAHKANAGSDYSCCTVWGMSDGMYHLIDVVLKKLEYPELKAEVIRLATRDKPFAILIEDKASGQSLLQELPVQIKQPLIGIMPHKDKVQRLSAVSIMIEGGRVWIPEGAFWLDGFLDQVKFFPNAKKDDAVDSMSQFLAWARDRFAPGDFGIKQHGGHTSAYDSLSLSHVSRDLGGSTAGKHNIGYDALNLDYLRKN